MRTEPQTEVLSAFPPHRRPLSCIQVRGGLSGGEVWRVQTEAGEAALRRWAAGFPVRRIALIHRLLTEARQQGFHCVPAPIPDSKGNTWRAVGSCIWEMCEWMPGEPATPEASDAELAAAARILARWHLLWEPGRLGDWALPLREDAAWRCFRDGATTPPPASARRLREWKRLLPVVESLPAETGERGELFARTLAGIRNVQSRMSSWLDQLLHVVPLRLCLRDVHREHVLLTGVEVTGLIDFGAVGLDSPAADLARLLGSLAPDQVERWEVAWDAYRQIAPLSPAEQRLSLLLDKTGTVVSAMRWAEWMLLTPSRMEDRLAVHRWSALLSRLERWREDENL